MTTLTAPAKLTVGLRITGRRPDGYHLIDAEMVSLDLHDSLDVSDGTGVEVIDARSGRRLEIEGVNLVSSALALCRRDARVVITKRIPAGAGLGGGSSDAAAILRWASFGDVEASARIGADVAFCLVGGRARVTGIGDIVEPLPFGDAVYTLVTPPFGCSTPDVYAEWDRLGGPVGDNGNDLEPAALALVPGLAEFRDELAGATGQTPRLAGSGSTWFVSGEYPGPGRVVTRTIRSR